MKTMDFFHKSAFIFTCLIALTFSIFGCKKEKVWEEELPVEPLAPGYVEGQDSYSKPQTDLLAKKIKASPIDYVGETVQLHLYFSRIDTSRLDDIEVYFPSKDYFSFIAFSGKYDSEYFHCLFIRKDKGDEIFQFKDGSPITIYGKVVSSRRNDPWIEVYEILGGWIKEDLNRISRKSNQDR